MYIQSNQHILNFDSQNIHMSFPAFVFICVCVAYMSGYQFVCVCV